MVDQTLSIFNIITTTATVIVTFLLIENHHEINLTPSEIMVPSCQPEMKNYTEECSLIDVQFMMAQIISKLKGDRLSDAISLWKYLENQELERNVLTQGLFGILNATYESSFASHILPWIKHVNVHIRLTAYDKIQEKFLNESSDGNKNNMIIFANFLKNEWITLKRSNILNKNERDNFVSTLKNFPSQIKTIILSSSVVIRSAENNGYMYATSNRNYWLDKKRTVYLWTPKIQSVAREGIWKINYEENSNSYIISTNHLEENLYSVCSNYNTDDNYSEKNDEYFKNIFTLPNELQSTFDCLCRWSIHVSDDKGKSGFNLVQLFMTGNRDRKNHTIYSLSLDRKPKPTTTTYNYRTQVFIKEHVNLTSVGELDLSHVFMDKWEIVPLSYIF